MKELSDGGAFHGPGCCAGPSALLSLRHSVHCEADWGGLIHNYQLFSSRGYKLLFNRLERSYEKLYSVGFFIQLCKNHKANPANIALSETKWLLWPSGKICK